MEEGGEWDEGETDVINRGSAHKAKHKEVKRRDKARCGYMSIFHVYYFL